MSPGPDDLHAWQEALGSYGELAANLWAMYDAFTSQGFAPEQALHLITAYFMKQLELYALREIAGQQGEDSNAQS